MGYREKALDFLQNEQQYRLGFLSSEASNSLTKNLDRDFNESTGQGIRSLLAVDRALESVLRRGLSHANFPLMVEAFRKALAGGHRIIFSGCGATGRLAILLEALWRDAGGGDEVVSIMTGGDYALVKSVEFFEDHAEFGRKQIAEINVGPGDVLVGITATGETSSIVGTAMESAERGAAVFMLICVDWRIPCEKLERCRNLYHHPQVKVIDMPCGGMALTGSTRMQSTTLETLVAAAALEEAAFGHKVDAVSGFMALVDALGTPALAEVLDFETAVYRADGLITYYTDDWLLDVLSDTTERTPTFKIPPFVKDGDTTSPPSWAFVKHPSLTTTAAWQSCLRRPPRCIEWSPGYYHECGAADIIAAGIPEIGAAELLKFKIGCEPVPQRRASELAIGFGKLPNCPQMKSLLIGPMDCDADFFIKYTSMPTRLKIFEHLAVKLTMNIISTGSMVQMGRVAGNYMIYLDVSNKKLIDRGVRIIAEQRNLSYDDACMELFKSMELCAGTGNSPVRDALTRLDKL